MSLRNQMRQYTETCSDAIERLKEALKDADAVVIGAGAGMSAAAGFEYTGERFKKYFSDFADKYGFKDMYSGGFYPYASLEEYWAYWSRYVFINRYMDAPEPVYDNLLNLIKGKNYFVITTNVDHCFQKTGFDKSLLFYTQGDYGLFQCSGPCRQETFDNEQTIRQMLELQKDMRIPSGLIPVCPRCGRPMTMNLRADDTFAEDDGWHRAAGRYAEFIQSLNGRRVLYFELGVGYNTPGIIKYPFWKLTAQNPRAIYACVNRGETYIPPEIADRTISIDADIAYVLEKLGF